jgi:ABC-type branched-subunit amino acid transport system ATPase component
VSDTALEIRDVVKAFGGNRALDGCSLAVRRGSITGVIGPNGAGKSTLFNIISGLLRPDRGELAFEDRYIQNLPAYKIARLGVARTFQSPREIGDMTTLQNLMLVPKHQSGERLASVISSWQRVWLEECQHQRDALSVLERVEMRHQENLPAAALSIGQKKLLELARCLLAEPKLALLDEPTAGVNPRLIGDLIRVMEQMSRDGATLLIIEHNMNVVMKLCEHVIVLHRGRVLRQGTPSEIQKDERVQDAYLGGVV